MRPLGFRHLPDLGLEICLVGEETEGERLLSGRLIREGLLGVKVYQFDNVQLRTA